MWAHTKTCDMRLLWTGPGPTWQMGPDTQGFGQMSPLALTLAIAELRFVSEIVKKGIPKLKDYNQKKKKKTKR